MKNINYFLFVIFILIFSNEASAKQKTEEIFSKETQECITCHVDQTPAIIQQWKDSVHSKKNVGCFECHQAQKGESDAFEHNGYLISVIVSPKDCARCHEKEVKEFSSSHHAKGGQIIGSLDNRLADIVEGNKRMITEGFPEGVSASVVMGCWQCHGSQVKVGKDGKLDPATWPNTGIGRINPDGSEGSCSACHARHAFSVEQARSPENCGKCHMGPDHPQLEIYEESKHGIAFHAFKDKMNLSNEKWVLGKDYSAAPTCATCHMGATSGQSVSHDIGLRISWNNRPAVSIRPEVSDEKLNLPGKNISWDKRRENMKEVCMNCHNENYVNNFYVQYDNLLSLYNEKFAKPGQELMKLAKPLLKPGEFSNPIDFTWFELWHHEGRRVRHGAAMMGPDYTHWHGMYEVSRNFYTKFVPELEEIIKQNISSADPQKVEQANKLKLKLDEVLASEDHKWYSR